MFRLVRRSLSSSSASAARPLQTIQPTISVTAGKVQVVSMNQPAAGGSAIAMVIPRGSRDEPATAAGAAHFAKHALFLGNPQESHLSMTRKAELRGSQFSVHLGREAITLLAEYAPVFQ